MVYASTTHPGGAFQGNLMFDRIDADDKLMEREELGQLEAVIERGQQTFVQVGQALAAIRDRRGYRHAGFATFERYLQQRWGWCRQRGYQLMQAAEVVTDLAGAGGMSTRMRRTVGNAPPSMLADAVALAWVRVLGRRGLLLSHGRTLHRDP
jgi:hypothetical protein